MTILEAKISFKSQLNIIDKGCNSVVFFWFLNKFGSAIGEFYSLVAHFLREINLNLLDLMNAKYLIIFFELHSLCVMNKNCMRGKNAKFQRTNSFHDLLACGSGVSPLCINVHSTLRIVIIIKIYIKSVPVFLLGRHELPPFDLFEPKQCCCEV